MTEQILQASFPVVLTHEIAVRGPEGKSAQQFEQALSRALAAFARRPHFFLEHVRACTVSEGRDDLGRLVLCRKLDFGNFVFQDEVLFVSPLQTVYCVPELEQTPASTFSIRVDPGEPLRISFTYREDIKAGLSDNFHVMTLRKNAWKAKDRDVIGRILARIGGTIVS